MIKLTICKYVMLPKLLPPALEPPHEIIRAAVAPRFIYGGKAREGEKSE